MDELREAFSAAYDQAESESDSQEDVSHESNETEAPIESVNTETETETETDKIEAAADQELPVEGKVEAATKPDKSDKAPASWTPKSRESWSKLPGEAKAQIAKREQEINTTLQQTAQARQSMAQLNRTLEPYRNGLIASGVQDPMQAIGALFKTESQLRGGTSQQKAQTIATLIKQYGVDIGSLDAILTGEPVQDTSTSKFEQLLDQRLQPVNQFLQNQQYQQQQSEFQMQQEATQSVTDFSSGAEFIDHVRHDMADMLDMAAKRNQPMTLEQAYEKACAINPEISSVMAQRAKDQQVMGTRNQMDGKRRASASLTGSRGGEGGGNATGSMRDVIADAWNNQTG